MGDAIDLTVNRYELYLLHDDGRLTLCIYSAFAVAPIAVHAALLGFAPG